MKAINYGRQTIRKIKEKDLLLTYNWSNDDLVRKNSISKKKILLKNHTSWFKKKINSNKDIIYISCINSNPVGMVRMEKKKNFFYLSYLISKKFRKKGLGFKMLSIFLKKFYKKSPYLKVKACILKNNYASIKIFEKVGFNEYKVDDKMIYYVLTKRNLNYENWKN